MGNLCELLKNIFNNWEKKKFIKDFKFKPITPKRMKFLINSLKNFNSECLDGISNHMVKISVDSLTLPMAFLFNKCIEHNIFPGSWKFCKVLALFKSKGNKEDPKFFRPMAILSPLLKLIEKELMLQMVHHMDSNSLWSNNMYAYRKSHNTTSTPLDLMEVWMDNVNNNFQNITMLLDLLAAFN